MSHILIGNFNYKNKKPVRNHKLEKADILELTVKHLRSLQKQKTTGGVKSDTSLMNTSRASSTSGDVTIQQHQQAACQRLLANYMRQYHQLGGGPSTIGDIQQTSRHLKSSADPSFSLMMMMTSSPPNGASSPRLDTERIKSESSNQVVDLCTMRRSSVSPISASSCSSSFSLMSHTLVNKSNKDNQLNSSLENLFSSSSSSSSPKHLVNGGDDRDQPVWKPYL